MDATEETTRGDHHFATEHFNDFGLDFRYVFSHLSNPHNIFPNALGSDSVSTPLEKQFWHTDVLRSGYDDQSPGSGNGGQLVFVSGYPSSGSSSRLTRIHNVKPEFWRRHLGFTSAASTRQFEDINVPSAICDVFQLRIWTIGYRGNGARSNQASVEALRRDSAKLMEDYRERLNTRSSFHHGDSVVRKYEVHDQEFFSIEQLVTIYVSTAHEKDKDGKNESWLAVVNSDCGRDLHESPKGPWLGDHLAYNASYYTRFLPVPDHRSSMNSYNDDLAQKHSRAKPRSGIRDLPQSLARLPEAHLNGSRDREVMQQDPCTLSMAYSRFSSPVKPKC